MGVRRGRAVAVGIPGRDLAALAENGFDLAGSAESGPEGLRLIEAAQPDLVLAAAIMPGMDGVAFARRARALRLNLRPDILLLKPPGLRLPGESNLAALGTLAMDAPLTGEKLAAALTRLGEMGQALPPQVAAKLRAMLDALGVPPHPGRECLARAVALVWRDRRRLRGLRKDLYPELARRTGLSPAQVERAIRHVIGVAWRDGDIEQQHRLFGDTIDARRGQPTGSEMIAQLAEELRWEA